ncbi:hypothetical protein HRO26_03330 [Treponema pectinovorum]|uniref:Ig-like domain-containing protein n=1 Tax=Treponema pectinovorum TaxID=164 RepID=UPI003D91CF41
MKNRFLIFKNFIFFVSFFVLNGCNFISFKEYEVNLVSSSEEGWFSEQEVQFEFSEEVEKLLAEKNVTLLKNKNSCEPVFTWKENTLFVKPKENFIKGNQYEIHIDGTFYLKNGGSFIDYSYFSFNYGKKGEEFKLVSDCKDEKDVNQKYEIYLQFNKSVNKALFTQNFSLSPHTEFDVIQSEDGTIFTIKPKDKWKINENYRYTVDSLISEDGWVLNKAISGSFKTQRFFDKVELLSFNPVLGNSNDSKSWLWFTQDEFDSVVCGKMGIGLIFNQEMDFNSIKNAFSISPEISGTLIQLKDEKNKFVYVTEDFYKLKTAYTASISKEAKNLLGQYISQKKRVSFKSIYDYLKIEKITINQKEFTDFPSLLQIGADENNDEDEAENNDENELKLSISVKFSDSISKEKLYESLNKIKFSLLFPSSSKAPVNLSATWNQERNEILLIYEKITKSTAEVNTTYRLKIVGGSNGIKTENGKYLEASQCVNIQVL